MPPPVAVYVVAAVVGVAALFAFKEYVYEPHIAPTLEAWAEDFLERRRAARSRRASAVPVGTSRRRRDSTSSSDSTPHNDGDQGEGDRAPMPDDFPIDAFELEALASREVDEWRNEVLRSQGQPRDGLRKRHRLRDDFDGFDSTSTTLDESFTSLTQTPLQYVISNVSSPTTRSSASLPVTPTRRLRSESQSTTVQRDGSTLLLDSHSPSSPIREIPVMLPNTASPVSAGRSPTDGTHIDITGPSPLAIPNAVNHSPTIEAAPHPLPFTPTYQVMADDSPFGPLLPDTPRSSAEMYGERPFSPITRVMGSSSSSVSTSGSRMHSSRANSMSSIRTLGSSGIRRKGSALVNEVLVGSSDDGSNEDHYAYASTSTFTLANSGPETNESVISSLSERYPAPPTPPVVISPPVSSVGIISAPSSPRSGGSEVVVHDDAMTSPPRSPFQPLSQTHPSLSLLQLPVDRSTSQSRSQTYSATSPALSYASFLSPMPVSRAASESEGDEFLSVASDDSDWGALPLTSGGPTGPVQDRANNPFLDVIRRRSSERGDGSEGSEVLISDLGQEGESEVGSDESWGSARRH